MADGFVPGFGDLEGAAQGGIFQSQQQIALFPGGFNNDYGNLTPEQQAQIPRHDERWNIGAPQGSLNQTLIDYSPVFHALSDSGTFHLNNDTNSPLFVDESGGRFREGAISVINGLIGGGGEIGQAALDSFWNDPLTQAEIENPENRVMMEWILTEAGYPYNDDVVPPSNYAVQGQWGQAWGPDNTQTGPANFQDPTAAVQFINDFATVGPGHTLVANSIASYTATQDGLVPFEEEDGIVTSTQPGIDGPNAGGYDYTHGGTLNNNDSFRADTYTGPLGGSDPLTDLANILSVNRQEEYGADRAPGDKPRGPTAHATTRANDIVAAKRRRSRLVAAGAAGRVNRPSPLASGSSQGLLAEDASAVGGALGSPSRRTL